MMYAAMRSRRSCAARLASAAAPGRPRSRARPPPARASASAVRAPPWPPRRARAARRRARLDVRLSTRMCRLVHLGERRERRERRGLDGAQRVGGGGASGSIGSVTRISRFASKSSDGVLATAFVSFSARRSISASTSLRLARRAVASRVDGRFGAARALACETPANAEAARAGAAAAPAGASASQSNAETPAGRASSSSSDERALEGAFFRLLDRLRGRRPRGDERKKRLRARPREPREVRGAARSIGRRARAAAARLRRADASTRARTTPSTRRVSVRRATRRRPRSSRLRRPFLCTAPVDAPRRFLREILRVNLINRAAPSPDAAALGALGADDSRVVSPCRRHDVENQPIDDVVHGVARGAGRAVASTRRAVAADGPRRGPSRGPARCAWRWLPSAWLPGGGGRKSRRRASSATRRGSGKRPSRAGFPGVVSLSVAPRVAPRLSAASRNRRAVRSEPTALTFSFSLSLCTASVARRARVRLNAARRRGFGIRVSASARPRASAASAAADAWRRWAGRASRPPRPAAGSAGATIPSGPSSPGSVGPRSGVSLNATSVGNASAGDAAGTNRLRQARARRRRVEIEAAATWRRRTFGVGLLLGRRRQNRRLRIFLRDGGGAVAGTGAGRGVGSVPYAARARSNDWFESRERLVAKATSPRRSLAQSRTLLSVARDASFARACAGPWSREAPREPRPSRASGFRETRGAVDASSVAGVLGTRRRVRTARRVPAGSGPSFSRGAANSRNSRGSRWGS